jgi:uncharacterized protein (DUF1015 family)
MRWQPVRVPRFEPFAAARYSPDDALDAVTGPPYDVLSVEQVERYRASDPHHITHVDVPLESDGPDRYTRAAAVLAGWLADGTLRRDETPTFTLYRMRFVDALGNERRTVGVLGALEVVDEGAGGVLPHERTTPKASTDRLDLTRATRTNLSPVWGLSLTAGLTDVLEPEGELVGVCTDEQGVEHRVERVSDPNRVARISAAVSGSPVLIADGHHRYAISRTYRDEQRLVGGNGSAETTLAYVAELVEHQLSIDAIHRLYTSCTAETLLDELSPFFDIAEAGPVDRRTPAEMAARGALCLVHPDGTGTWLHAKPGAFDDVRALDGAWLEHALHASTAEVTYQHGVDEVLDALHHGSAAAAVLIRPVSITEIRRTADEGLLMPPKSTFFTPKLRTGLVMRPLD